jgi:CRISPR-associated endonuclease/helicase Cas3
VVTATVLTVDSTTNPPLVGTRGAHTEIVINLHIWGKQRGLAGSRCYTLVCHLLDTAAVVRILWRDFVAPSYRMMLAAHLDLSATDAGRLVEFWAALHDIGKTAPHFQDQVQIPAGYPSSPGHTTYGHDENTHLWLVSVLNELGYPQGKRSLSSLVAQLLGGHHGRFHSFTRQQCAPGKLPFMGLGEGVWEEQRRAIATALRQILDPPLPTTPMRRSVAVTVTGLVILADWLASQVPYINTRLAQVPRSGTLAELRHFFQGSVAAAPGLVDRAGLARLGLRPGSFVEEFPGFPPNTLQTSLARDLPSLLRRAGMLMIAAPTGFGKTEAALHAARLMGEVSGYGGLYVALPTTATADQMFRRIAEYLTRRSSRPNTQALLHSMAWLSPVEEMISSAGAAEGISADGPTQVWFSEWMRGTKRAMLAGVGVGTVDQALLSVLPVRHNALRLFALAGKTVVFDEVHAFSPYMRRLLEVLLQWLGELGVPVILLSATLPAHVATRLANAYLGRAHPSVELPDPVVAYPGWTYLERGAAVAPNPKPIEFPDDLQRTIGLSIRPVTMEEGQPDRMPVIREELGPLIKEGGCAAVICTTVAQAQQTRTAIMEWREHLSPDQQPVVTLLHSRFPVHRREGITNDVIASFGKDGDRPARAILIATQVVEQSLDIDLDLVITDVAPIELLVQRAGRLQRHSLLNGKRPAWAAVNRGGQQRLVVLTAPQEDLALLPAAWKFVYPEASLIRADRLVREHLTSGIRIPDAVQSLVDRGNPGDLPAYEDPLLEGFERAEVARGAEVLVESETASTRSVPVPSSLQNLAEMTDKPFDEGSAMTRFDADSERVLPCYEDAAGQLRVGSPTGEPLPEPDDRGHLTREQLIDVMRHSIPVPGRWVVNRGDEHLLPKPHRDIWPLSGLVILRYRVQPTGEVEPAAIGDHQFRLDEDLGLVETTQTP